MDLATIFLLIVFALLGVAVGSLLQGGLNRRKDQPTKRTSTPQASPEDSNAAAGDVEILRAWRTLSGRLWLEMDGERMNGKEVLKKDQHRRLVSMLVDLRTWLESSPGTRTAPESLLPAAEVPSPSQTGDEKAAGNEIKPVPAQISLVSQIEVVLQKKLKASPFASREVHLLEGPDGKVFIMDGQQKYEGIDSVPEAEIRTLIHQAVSDWESLPH